MSVTAVLSAPSALALTGYPLAVAYQAASSYATVADMLVWFGERELRELTDRTQSGLIDRIAVQRALDTATAIVDGRLAKGGYVVPATALPGQTLAPIPALCGDIARFYLFSDMTVILKDTSVDERYKAAIAQLDSYASSKTNLPNLVVVAGPAAGIAYTRPVSTFDRDPGTPKTWSTGQWA